MTLYAIDTETTGLSSFHGDRPFLCGLYDGENYIITDDWNKIQELFDDKNNEFILANAKFDLHMFNSVGIVYDNIVLYDVILAASLLDENRKSIALKQLTRDYLGHTTDSETELKEQLKAVDNRFDKVDRDLLIKYLKDDVKYTLELFHLFKPQLEEQNLWDLFMMENQLCKVLVDMEKEGILVDKNKINSTTKYLENKLKFVVKELSAKFPNVEYTSNKQLGEYLISQGIAVKYTFKGAIGVEGDYLKEYNHPICELVLEYRKLDKLLTTYCNGFSKLVDKDWVLHPNIISFKTVTGRFSCSEPNIQNLPKPVEENPYSILIRELLIPKKDFIVVSMDYSQIEYRIAADYAGDDELMQAIADGKDVHEFQAKRVFKKDKVTKKERSDAKGLNFAILYGAGIKRISNMLGISETEAKTLRQQFDKENPKLTALNALIKRTFNNRSYIFNKYGRRYRIPKDKQYKALNYLCQGTGTGDMMKDVMIRTHAFLKDKKSRLIMNIHDELIFNVHKDEIKIINNLKDIMQDFNDRFKVKIEVSIAWSDENWAKLKEEVIW